MPQGLVFQHYALPKPHWLRSVLGMDVWDWFSDLWSVTMKLTHVFLNQGLRYALVFCFCQVLLRAAACSENKRTLRAQVCIMRLARVAWTQHNAFSVFEILWCSSSHAFSVADLYCIVPLLLAPVGSCRLRRHYASPLPCETALCIMQLYPGDVEQHYALLGAGRFSTIGRHYAFRIVPLSVKGLTV